MTKMQSACEKHPDLLSNARGKGLYCAMDAVSGDVRKKLLSAVFEKGAIILPSGEKAIRFRPSLNIEKKHIDECFDIIEASIKELK